MSESPDPEDDVKWMTEALSLARLAADAGEVPVGAVLVCNGVQLAAAHNRPIGDHDPTAHAEVRVLRSAGQLCKNYRLTGTTLYVTLEPCAMCAVALVHARVGRLVFGATDPRAGAAGSVWDLVRDRRLNHQLAVTQGVLREPCEQLLRDFFRARR